MAFVSAMSAPEIKQGVKGSDVYTEEGVGDLRVVLFTQLVRGFSATESEHLVSKILALESREQAVDLVVMTFQTRDIRGGKGERALFHNLLFSILTARPAWQSELLELVPEYGYWQDLWVLWKMAAGQPALRAAIDAVVVKQFRLDQESEKPSLLAKWLPREGSKYDELATHFASLFFSATPAPGGQRMRTYRRALATLNRALDTTEVKMCGRTWANIVPKKVPGRLMKRCKSAFFNQKKNGRETVERWPAVEDRKLCAEHFREFLVDVASGKETMKGGQTTMPHEHVAEIQRSFRQKGSKEVEETRQAQWNAIRDETLAAGGLGKIVPMCDFSGSMSGTPMEVSLALGILISEVASPAFRDHILTFDSTPKWHSFAAKKTLREKVEAVGSLGQGLSTDFQAACELVLRRLVEHKVAPEDAPTDLLVLTDMGFDSACGSDRTSQYTGNTYSHVKKSKSWQTHFQMIRESFETHGYKAPRIVCWNLRDEYKDYHARAHEEGVVQLSGWSPAVLKALQRGGVSVQTPYQGMRELLDDERYDLVRRAMELLWPSGLIVESVVVATVA
jgi:Domain of unknown function (DUF2828)